jgi:DNA-binding response OmpR family regulator
MKRHILIIDDDRSLQALLSDYFRTNNCSVESAFTGEEGMDLLHKTGNEPFDIIVLDIMLPDMDGFETLRRIRTVSTVPVIMLTARIDETDRIVGLEMGADDYMHKPFNPRELVARIKAVLRRGQDPSPAQPKKVTPGIIHSGSIVIDTEKCKVFKDGMDLGLSSLEFDIVRELASAPGRPFSRDHLLTIARGRDFEAFDRSIDVHISRIRKKIEPDPARPRTIKTVWGKGYAWEE